MGKRFDGVSIVVIPEEGGESRTFKISRRRGKVFLVSAVAFILVLGFMVTSWWYFALNTARNWQLKALVDSLESERGQVLALAEEMGRVEAEYEHLRSLFGIEGGSMGSDLWLPPSGLPGSRSASARAGAEPQIPTAWPLTEAGFITQPLLAGAGGDHPGLDIAVPTDSYIRASGSGRVLRVGEDPTYGLFVVLDHGEGYQSIYGHVSNILVERGQAVRRQEVIALSGSTGQSTAPHLHFEILLDGIPVDPLSLMEQPG
jgi:murein DD-endopeptidase MepM/ murein hydrolase activator NlpD